MAKRKVDMLVGKDTLSDKLRKRRNAIESGDPSGVQDMNDTDLNNDVSNSDYMTQKRGYHIISEKEDL